MRIERLDETTRKNLLEDLLKRSPNSYGTYEASVREILDEVKKTDVTKPCSLIRKNLTVQHLMRIIFR